MNLTAIYTFVESHLNFGRTEFIGFAVITRPFCFHVRVWLVDDPCVYVCCDDDISVVPRNNLSQRPGKNVQWNFTISKLFVSIKECEESAERTKQHFINACAALKISFSFDQDCLFRNICVCFFLVSHRNVLSTEKARFSLVCEYGMQSLVSF